MTKRRIILVLAALVLLTGIILLITHLIGPGVVVEDAQGVLYYCPMHPTYASPKPGDCPLCNMRLVKKEAASQATSISQVASASQDKTLEEVCIEHHCTMKDCPMHVRAHIKPGEKLICPICGEVIATTNGKVVEIAKQPSQATSPAANTGESARQKERQILYYRNPMNPQATSPVPMKDPMGMDYIPVYKEGAPDASGPTVTINPQMQQLIGVKSEPVKKINLTTMVRASGKIAYDPELVVAQEEFIQALNNEDNIKDSPLADVITRAKSLTEAARNKLKLLGLSDEQIAALTISRKADNSLYLPLQGENVWAYVAIYEYEIGLVKVGAAVDIEAVAYPGQTFKGNVVSINPVLDANTRTNQIRVEVANPESKLKPEMFVNANIRVEIGEKLAVPESAIFDTGLRKIVYLSREGGVLESREVTTGRKAQGYYEVLDGLSEGDVVITSGNFLVDSESRLQSAIGGAAEEHKHGQ
ncbi:MAG: efflux RND transporter periplasmic adaptor subunit [Candidatus Omnitrophica bacterium]|nr:efflux RND transporter periplasmic adaptor subunit [Candidatus Omnitrophota bacterium]